VDIWTLDFETYFSDDYTLKKMTTEEYIRDERFQAHMLGARDPRGNLAWHEHSDIPDFLASVDWSRCGVLCHHAHFDGLILSHHNGVKPGAWLDTLSMGRLVLGNHIKLGLDSLASHFGLEGKSVPYDQFKGLRWEAIPHYLRRLLGSGCVHDVELTWDIFCRLARGFPVEEYQVIDHTIRMFTEPQFVGDLDAFGKVWTDEQQSKAQRLAQLGISGDALQSSEKFASLLREQGVEPETKISPKGNTNYAFAKTDEFMKGLLEHEDETVALLAAARLGEKSTLDQSRAERLGFMATRGPMPVYLNYCGAHTTRWSGGDKVNWQNFRRGGGLRKGVKAPAGHVILKADKSQIECRILNHVAGQTDVIERFRNHEDPYIGIASQFYGRPITKADPAERGVGKQLELSCGYGAGASTIVATARRGTYGPPVILTESEGLSARDLYRSTHPGVVAYWRTAELNLKRMDNFLSFDWGPMAVCCDVDKGTRRIVLPNGAQLIYDTLEWHTEENGDSYWRQRKRYGWTKLYGAKLVENVIQALSRVDMSQSMLRIYQRSGYRAALTEHDAGYWVVRTGDAGAMLKVVEEEMTRTPDWLPGIPIGCEAQVGETM